MAELKFSGGPALEAALRDLGSEIAGRLGSNAVRAGARVIAASARSKAPVLTGALKNSIRVFEDQDVRRAGGAERTAYAGTRVFYAKFVEFGTVHVPARSFLRAASDESAQQAVDKLADNLGAGIERETAKYRR